MESLVNRVPVLANRNMPVSFGSLVVEGLEEYTLSDSFGWVTVYRSNMVSDRYFIGPAQDIWILVAYILEVPVSVTLKALLAKLSNCLKTVIFSV